MNGFSTAKLRREAWLETDEVSKAERHRTVEVRGKLAVRQLDRLLVGREAPVTQEGDLVVEPLRPRLRHGTNVQAPSGPSDTFRA